MRLMDWMKLGYLLLGDFRPSVCRDWGEDIGFFGEAAAAPAILEA